MLDPDEYDYEYMDMDEDPAGGSSPLEIMIKCAIVGLIGVFCVVGNILVIRTLIFFKHPKIPIYMMICGLAVADLLTAVVEIPNFVMSWTSENNTITEEWCSAINYLTSTCKYVAACHLAGLAIIRCIMLNDRHHSRNYVVHVGIGSIAVWILVILANLPSAINSTVKKLDAGEDADYDSIPSQCVTQEGMQDHAERNKWLRISFSYVVPMSVALIVYVVTWCFTQRYYEDSYSHGERRLSRMVTLLIGTFAVIKLPIHIVNIMIFYTTRQLKDAFELQQLDESTAIINRLKTGVDMRYVFECVATLDLAIRPFIYAKQSYYFRKSFDEILNCTVICKNSREHTRRNVKRKRKWPIQTPLTEENELDESPELDNHTIQMNGHLDTVVVNAEISPEPIGKSKDSIAQP